MKVEEYFQNISNAINRIELDITELKEDSAGSKINIEWIKAKLSTGQDTFSDHDMRIRHLEWKVAAIIAILAVTGCGGVYWVW